jgi:hypothetical protein
MAELLPNLRLRTFHRLLCNFYREVFPQEGLSDILGVRIEVMSGRQRLPGGAPRKASQRKSKRAPPVTFRISPTWRAGDGVRWQGRAGVFRRDVGDGEHAEIIISERVYRVRIRELA